MSDEAKLEELTAMFTKALIVLKFEDLNFYKDLAQRMAALINAEVYWQTTYDKNLDLMQFWGDRN
jgi:hypothetical protein